MAYIPHSILVITPDRDFGQTLHTHLTSHDYTVQIVTDVLHAVHILHLKAPSLLIIDRRCISTAWQVVEAGIFQRIRHLAIQPPGLPCDEDECADEINQGLDFVICGESYRQIMARIKAIVKPKSELAQSRRLVVGEVVIDRDRYEVTVGGLPIDLTRIQYKILEVMCQEPTRALSRDEIVNKVWGHDIAIQEHTLDVHVHALRKKIERHMAKPDLIQTIHGFGFRLRVPIVS